MLEGPKNNLGLVMKYFKYVFKLWTCLVLTVKKNNVWLFNFVDVENTEETLLDCSLLKLNKKDFKY